MTQTHNKYARTRHWTTTSTRVLQDTYTLKYETSHVVSTSHYTFRTLHQHYYLIYSFASKIFFFPALTFGNNFFFLYSSLFLSSCERLALTFSTTTFDFPFTYFVSLSFSEPLSCYSNESSLLTIKHFPTFSPALT